MEEHRRYLDSGKEDAFGEAEEEAMKGEWLNGEEWESLPNKYIGKCDKNCYGWRKMEKVEVVDFGVRVFMFALFVAMPILPFTCLVQEAENL